MGKEKILVVDDDPGVLDALGILLDKAGYEVLRATSGQEALRMARDFSPDLILLDRRLPEKDGLEVCRALRRIEAGSDSFTPVIFLTVDSAMESRVEGLEAGADDYVTKPFQREELLARVAARLRAKQHVDRLRNIKRELEGLSLTDGLTGLFNYRYLSRRLQHEFSRSVRYGLPLAVLLIDLDHFKEVNDRFGHLFGDTVLVGTAQALRSCMRECDVIARYGGEEFLALLPNTGLAGGERLAARVGRAVASQPYECNGVPFSVTASVGVAAIPCPGVDTPERLVAAADKALYRAKGGGRNRSVSYHPSFEVEGQGKKP